MRLRSLNVFSPLSRLFGDASARPLANRQGNIALTFGLAAMPPMLDVGVGIDGFSTNNARMRCTIARRFPNFLISAAAPKDIENGLSSLFQQHLGSVRLTP